LLVAASQIETGPADMDVVRFDFVSQEAAGLTVGWPGRGALGDVEM
jgi:hypothetical protein